MASKHCTEWLSNRTISMENDSRIYCRWVENIYNDSPWFQVHLCSRGHVEALCWSAYLTEIMFSCSIKMSVSSFSQRAQGWRGGKIQSYYSNAILCGKMTTADTLKTSLQFYREPPLWQGKHPCWLLITSTIKAHSARSVTDHKKKWQIEGTKIENVLISIPLNPWPPVEPTLSGSNKRTHPLASILSTAKQWWSMPQDQLTDEEVEY